jgi:hypothetical protein
MTAIAVAGTVRARAIAAGAEAWLEGLPDLVASFERDWAMTVGRGAEVLTLTPGPSPTAEGEG